MKKTVCIVGLGYVGLPIAIGFAKNNIKTIGFDVSKDKIEKLHMGIDYTGELHDKNDLNNKNISYTDDETQIKEADYVIVAVPTPITKSKEPDLKFLENASKTIGKNLKKGAIVCYESTVYPGVTEEICQPILEEHSKLKCGTDFKIAYSPERINPSDKVNTLATVIKVVSGMDKETLEEIAELYKHVAKAGVYKAKNIKTAETIKIIENCQRDVNIALANELARMCKKFNIKTKDVLDGAETKWNWYKSYPGLVGGHCIAVDPYYLIWKSEEKGYTPKLLKAARATNDNMPHFVATQIIKTLNKTGKPIKGQKLAVLGLTFKENTPDVRTSLTNKVISELKEYDIEILGVEPLIKDKEVKKVFNVTNYDFPSIKEVDGFVVLTPHDEFKKLDLEALKSKCKDKPILYDMKSIYEKEDAEKLGFIYNCL